MAFDECMEPEIQRVLDTSSILQISEFEVFKLSYDRWFGIPADDRLIEPFFCDYMFQMVVPSWVNHFTRKVLHLYQSGQLDPANFGILPKPFNNNTFRIGILLVVTICVTLVCLLLLAANVADFYDLTGIFR